MKIIQFPSRALRAIESKSPNPRGLGCALVLCLLLGGCKESTREVGVTPVRDRTAPLSPASRAELESQGAICSAGTDTPVVCTWSGGAAECVINFDGADQLVGLRCDVGRLSYRCQRGGAYSFCRWSDDPECGEIYAPAWQYVTYACGAEFAAFFGSPGSSDAGSPAWTPDAGSPAWTPDAGSPAWTPDAGQNPGDDDLLRLWSGCLDEGEMLVSGTLDALRAGTPDGPCVRCHLGTDSFEGIASSRDSLELLFEVPVTEDDVVVDTEALLRAGSGLTGHPSFIAVRLVGALETWADSTRERLHAGQCGPPRF